MADEKNSERIKRDLDRLVEAVKTDGVAGGTVGPGGLTMGEPNWEERTKKQRFSEKVRTHGYPLGLAKGTIWRRNGLVTSFRQRVENSSDTQREKHEAVHEAMAWALDAERFLGSFNRGSSGNFPVEAVDEVADHLLIWLEEQGFGVFPLDSNDHLNPQVRETALFVDVFSGMVLDKSTHGLYLQIKERTLPRKSLYNRTALNVGAAAWARALRLSALHPDEKAPPTGRVGQYGKHGCVLIDSLTELSTTFQDVCLISYEPRNFGRFVREVAQNRYAKFVYSKVTDTDLIESITGSHPVSLRGVGPGLDTDFPVHGSELDVEAAVKWGLEHARHLTRNMGEGGPTYQW